MARNQTHCRFRRNLVLADTRTQRDTKVTAPRSTPVWSLCYYFRVWCCMTLVKFAWKSALRRTFLVWPRSTLLNNRKMFSTTAHSLAAKTSDHSVIHSCTADKELFDWFRSSAKIFFRAAKSWSLCPLCWRVDGWWLCLCGDWRWLKFDRRVDVSIGRGNNDVEQLLCVICMISVVFLCVVTVMLVFDFPWGIREKCEVLDEKKSYEHVCSRSDVSQQTLFFSWTTGLSLRWNFGFFRLFKWFFNQNKFFIFASSRAPKQPIAVQNTRAPTETLFSADSVIRRHEP